MNLKFDSVGYEDGVTCYRTENVYWKDVVQKWYCLKKTTISPINLNVHDEASTNSENIFVVVNNVKGYRSIQANSAVQ